MERFTKLGPDGQPTSGDHVAVLDNSTGLIWDATETKSMTWAQAKKYCAQLSTAGFTDWRLPTVQEFVAILDYSRCDPAIDIEAFPNCKSDFYWTGTEAAFPLIYAWLVNLLDGDVSRDAQTLHNDVRAVRANQSLTFGLSK